ncbi:MAG TPA: hypothetical protein P5026_01440 [Kiritimatiellia bacterium]|mgnify:CR=1 FL=1|nr:hypothetical protein [Kiritimatiellia bacterium]HRR32738.1 hypothetical protein [Kiritimatiellia bacterium]HRU69839.1 hypothetical protein [Kiritimatiellia bacterium]
MRGGGADALFRGQQELHVADQAIERCGVYRGKRIWVDPPADMPLDWCEGIVPVSATEEVRVRWRKVSGVPEATVDVPEGWTVVK